MLAKPFIPKEQFLISFSIYMAHSIRVHHVTRSKQNHDGTNTTLRMGLSFFLFNLISDGRSLSFDKNNKITKHIRCELKPATRNKLSSNGLTGGAKYHWKYTTDQNNYFILRSCSSHLISMCTNCSGLKRTKIDWQRQ